MNDDPAFIVGAARVMRGDGPGVLVETRNARFLLVQKGTYIRKADFLNAALMSGSGHVNYTPSGRSSIASPLDRDLGIRCSASRNIFLRLAQKSQGLSVPLLLGALGLSCDLPEGFGAFVVVPYRLRDCVIATAFRGVD